MDDEIEVTNAYQFLVNFVTQALARASEEKHLREKKREQLRKLMTDARETVSRLESSPSIGVVFKCANLWRTNKMTITKLYGLALILGYTPGKEEHKIDPLTGRTVLWFGENLNMTIRQAQRFDLSNVLGYVKTPFVDLPELTKSQKAWYRNFTNVANEYWEAKYIVKDADAEFSKAVTDDEEPLKSVLDTINTRHRYIRRLIRKGYSATQILNELDPLVMSLIVKYARG